MPNVDEQERPLAVAVAALVDGGKILLIRRKRGDYVDLWGLPGGKVEPGERLSRAAVREMAEESGVRTKFRKYLGLVSEHLLEEGKIKKHFLLHVCELSIESASRPGGEEGEPRWFELLGIEAMRDRIIPSDFVIIREMVMAGSCGYYECVMEKRGSRYSLLEFVRSLSE